MRWWTAFLPVFVWVNEVNAVETIRNLWNKYREPIGYLFFGVLTTAVSFLSAGWGKWVLERLGGSTDVIATVSTVFSWICAVTFAYVTNRVWVFQSTATGFAAIAKEAAAFYGGRVTTLLFETAFMWLGISLLSFDYWWTKIAANVVVLILNYVISKLVVFRKQ